MKSNAWSTDVILFLLCSFFLVSARAQEAKPLITPEGSAKSAKTKTLEAGAKILQSKAPLSNFNVYMVGFHPLKEHPEHQMEAHHLCEQVNEDFAQCVLFDGNTEDANLNGVEYIISEKLFSQLPKEERKYWHPHNYEILSGQLVAPELPKTAEKEFLKQKMNSYGKTWHFWNTGHAGANAGQKLPMGPANLAWSFNRDGEAKPEMVQAMEKKMNVQISEKRKERQDLAPLAKPQEGSEALKDKLKK